MIDYPMVFKLTAEIFEHIRMRLYPLESATRSEIVKELTHALKDAEND